MWTIWILCGRGGGNKHDLKVTSGNGPSCSDRGHGFQQLHSRPPLTSPLLCSGNLETQTLDPNPYLEGQGDLVSRLTMGIIRVTIWVIGVSNLLTKSP